jgi:hypothetical protein
MRRKSAEARRAAFAKAQDWLVDLDPAQRAWGEAIRGTAQLQDLALEAHAEVTRTGEEHLAAALTLSDLPDSTPSASETLLAAEQASIRWRLAMARYAVALDVMTPEEREEHARRLAAKAGR